MYAPKNNQKSNWFEQREKNGIATLQKKKERKKSQKFPNFNF